MAKDKNILAEGGLKFFGRMSASATHEIKNTLAIINESAGLLEDLSLMADKGNPISARRITDISHMVARQVKRADLVLKKLNRFSHSVDLSTKVIDLEQTLCFVLDLATRLIERQGVKVEVKAPGAPMMVVANLFYLENIIWNAIETACCTAKNNVLISFENNLKAPSIWFSMDTVKNDLMNKLFDSKEDKTLMEYLDISIKKNKENTGFGLLWPMPI
jgi:C4-dicarboxylate-specific signal transduction histidine kinase